MKVRWIALLATLAFAGVVVGLLAWAMLNKEPVTGRSGETRVGKPAPDVRLEAFDGSSFALSDHLGSPIVLNFWASWCLPCRDEAPALKELWNRWHGQGLVLVGINSQDGYDDASAFLTEFNVPYLNVIDTDGIASIDYGVVGLPVTMFIGKDGVVRQRYVGALKLDIVEPWIQGLVAEASPVGSMTVESQ